MTGVDGREDRRPVRMRIAENVRIRRLLHNWSQEDLAQEAGLDRSFVGDIERAERNISIKTLEKLAIAFDVEPVDLAVEMDATTLGERIIATVRENVSLGVPTRVK
ncbi:MAG: XRE family transcriptional regulator [Gammaproteobacteria bacterium HGW-Gammaproteobacteria-1]|jgi:transcriptional regulator with XRE-family HTH domain|nr:MAG: XRE family transcriptional regulator [Gammaproteobacteria bacterium HGW-Gammaproteobacteria-1]